MIDVEGVKITVQGQFGEAIVEGLLSKVVIAEDLTDKVGNSARFPAGQIQAQRGNSERCGEEQKAESKFHDVLLDVTMHRFGPESIFFV